MMKLDDQLAFYRAQIENALKTYYASFHAEPQKLLFDAVEYSLLGGGKRLRPIFTLEFCRMCGKSYDVALPFATAVEMIQTYSLIHDDLPAMDNDDFRRGRPTNHKVYGEGMAILAGDALLTDAFGVLTTAQVDDRARIADAAFVLSRCAGSLGMVGGQVLDIMSEERALSEQEVLDIQSRKTGALIEAACVLGVIAGGGTTEQMLAAAEFARALGLAFQIRDDMLDVVGTQEEMGKGVGTDSDKNTFVRLYGLERCEMLVNDYTAKAIESLSCFSDTAFLTELAHSLTQRRV